VSPLTSLVVAFVVVCLVAILRTPRSQVAETVAALADLVRAMWRR
jgi:hypothetical protein